jgi:diaminopropionate ammonia-lyase
VCVEPLAADCLYRSAAAGRLVPVPGDLDTVMACLSAGEASLLGWKILGSGATAFVAVNDASAVEAMRFLARPGGGQTPLVVGESGAAGVAGLMAVGGDAGARRQLELDAGSRVLLFATEGATDAQAYESLVGCSPEEVGRFTHG